MRKIIFAAICLISFNAIAGPLGLNKGMTLEELKAHGDFVPQDQPFVYKATTIKNGHPDFESYMVILTPKQGLCKIRAVGKTIDTSRFGNELKDRHASIIEAMSEKYERPGRSFDFLRSGSIWKEPQYWMRSLAEKERSLTAFWSKPENNNLPDSLQSIMLDAHALSGTRGYLSISYEFDNLNACVDVIKAKRNSNL